MSEQKTFQTPQYIPVTIAEMKSASDNGNGIFESMNGVQFTNIETVGVVQSIKQKEEGGVTISIGTSFKPTPDIIYAFSGKFTDDAVLSTMARLQQYSIVIVRGRFTAYIKENEERQGINPHQIIELDSAGGKDIRTRELWFYKLLFNRVANRFPIIIGDDTYCIMTRDGIASAPAGGDMVVVNPSAAVSGGTIKPAPAPAPKPAPITAHPAPKPAMPEKIAAPKPVSKPAPGPQKGPAEMTRDDSVVCKIVEAVANQSGSSRDEILGEIDGMSNGGLMPALASAIECAKIHEVDVSAIVQKHAQNPEKPVKKPASISGEKDQREDIIKAIILQTGLSREEIKKRVDDTVAKFKDLIKDDGALVMLADKLSVNLQSAPAAAAAKAPAVEAASPAPAKTPAKKAKKTAKAPARSESDVAGEIIGYLDEHGGTANITELYTSFQGNGIESNIAEAAIIALQGDGKIVIDGETVAKA